MAGEVVGEAGEVEGQGDPLAEQVSGDVMVASGSNKEASAENVRLKFYKYFSII